MIVIKMMMMEGREVLWWLDLWGSGGGHAVMGECGDGANGDDDDDGDGDDDDDGDGDDDDNDGMEVLWWLDLGGLGGGHANMQHTHTNKMGW